jgi:predicted RNA-binding Zn-ribbon protein involved in translation (DUF1610 family)
MNTLLLAVIVIAGVAVFLALAKGKGGTRSYPYQLSKYLLSKAERSFYGVLVQAVGNSGIVFSKVRVADVISPKKGQNRSDWQRAFNAISSKHFDFIVCEPSDCSIKLAVELDDSSHGSSKAQKRDDLLNGACESAGLPLLRVKAAKSYVVAELQRQVEEAISPQPIMPGESAPPAIVEPPASVAQPEGGIAAPAALESGPGIEDEPVLVEAQGVKSESKVCPKCGEPMVLRKAKSGANAGQEFWGCSAFPKCRTVVPAGA